MKELVQINQRIETLRRKAKALQAKRRPKAIAAIVRQMAELDIQPEELAAAMRAQERRKGSASRKTAVQPKYRHPDTGATWSGRGRTPRWLLESADAVGKSRDEFLISHS